MNKFFCLLVMMILVISLQGVLNKVGEIRVNSGAQATVVTVVDTLLYVNSSFLYIYNISEPANPTLLGQVLTGYTIPTAIEVKNNIAYLVGASLLTVDVSDSYNPILLGSVFLGYCGDYNASLVIKGNYAYVSPGGSQFMKMVDVSDPLNLTIVGSYLAPFTVTAIAVIDNYVYLGLEGYDDLLILDCSDVGNLVLVSSLPVYDTIVRMVSKDNLIVYATQLWFVTVMDVTDPVNPITYTINQDWNFCCFSDVWISDAMVFVASQDWGVISLDISDLNNISVIDLYQTKNTPQYVVTNENCAIVTQMFSFTIELIDVTEPEDNESIGGIIDPIGIRSMSVDNNLAGMVRYNRLAVYDTGNPQNWLLAGMINENCGNSLLSFQGNIAYWLKNDTVLQILSLSDPSNPTILGTYNSGLNCSKFMVENSRVYLVDNNSGLYLVNVSDPANPYLEGYYSIQWGSNICVRNSIVYLIWENSTLQIVDWSNPQIPQLIGSLDIGTTNYALTVYQSYAYVLNSNDGIRCIDISDPCNPILTNTVLSPQTYRFWDHCMAYNNVLYVTNNNWNRIHCYDLRQPQSPVLFNTYKRNIQTKYMKVDNDRLYTSNLVHNVRILNLAVVENADDYLIQTPIRNFQCFPNPFNSGVSVFVELPKTTKLQLAVYNLKGQLVRALCNEQKTKGKHVLHWDGRDSFGNEVAQGVYVIKLETEGKKYLDKLTKLRW